MSTKLWYDRYQEGWLHALPLGNGKLAAMFFGNPETERIQMNEESIFTGSRLEESYNNDPAVLRQIQDLLFAGEYAQAKALSDRYFLAEPHRVRFYQNAGDLFLAFPEGGGVTGYRKELDLATGIAGAGYTRGGVAYESQCFVSQAYNVMCYRIRTPGGEKFSLEMHYERIDSRRDIREAAYNAILGQKLTVSAAGDSILVDGQAIDGPHEDFGPGGESVRFGGRAQLVSDGAVETVGSTLTVTNASEVVVFASFETDYDVNLFAFDREKDYFAVLEARLAAAAAAGFAAIRQQHIQDHVRAFGNVQLQLQGADYSHLPTDRRLQQIKEGVQDDLDFYTLYFQYGRYLLLASSGGNATLPANLQGKWTDDFMPPWGSDYHTNINLQMNYWIANVGNIHQTVQPLVHFMKMIAGFGEKTAREMYQARGWVLHHTTDIYGRTGVHDGSHWGFFPMAGPWLCMNLWEQYAFTGDEDYLKNTLYPILKGACLFLQDFLVEDSEGRLVTNPSNSPENEYYYTDANGEKKQTMLTYGATIDFEIIYAVFHRMIYAARHLGVDGDFARELEQILQRIPTLKVGQRYGTIQEWIGDFEETEPQHRHISHLFGLYPSEQINASDPVLFDAAKKTIARRLAYGGGATGWSRAWIINFYARLLDGENAGEHLRQLMARSTVDNLFDMHPPFQIDGNFGGAAGVAEMLLQSHQGDFGQRELTLLPAVPESWHSGSFRGLCARGNFTVDAAWAAGKLTGLTVHAPTGGECRIRRNAAMANVCPAADCRQEEDLLVVNVAPGSAYTFTFQA